MCSIPQSLTLFIMVGSCLFKEGLDTGTLGVSKLGHSVFGSDGVSVQSFFE